MDILDFIPDLPTDEKLVTENKNKLLEYREFSELRKEEKVFHSYYNHQMLPMRLLLYVADFLIIKYPMGTGKTLTGNLTGFFLSNDLPYMANGVLILGPNENILSIFEQDIKLHFGDVYINRKGVFTTHRMRTDFEFQSVESFMNDVFMQKRRKKGDTTEEPTDEERAVRLEEVIHRYSNRVIIVDEAHYLRDNIQGKNIYKQMRKFFSLLKGSKVIFMSGTLMVNKPEDFVSVANLVLEDEIPQDLDLMEDDEIEEILTKSLGKNLLYLDDRPVNVKINYLRSDPSDPDATLKLDGKKVSYTPYYVELVGYQKRKYEEVADKLEDEKKAFHILERTLSIIAYPPIKTSKLEDEMREDTEDRLGGREFEFFFNEGGLNEKLYNVTYDEEENIDNVSYKEDGKHTFKDMLIGNLSSFSSKFANLIQDMKDRPKEGFVVYSFFKWAGAYPLGEILKLYGYQEYFPMARHYKSKKKEGEERYHFKNITKPSTKEKRFIILEGSSARIETLMDIYNMKKNKYGEYIQLLILPHGLIFGQNVFNGRNMYHLGYPWNEATKDQADARLQRGEQTLKHLEKLEERYINYAYMTAFIPGQELIENIEAKAYLRAKRKYVDITRINNIIKKVSIDGGINNRKDIITVPKKQKETNYHLFYFKLIINEVKRQIKDVFTYVDVMYFDTMLEKLKKYTTKDLILTLADMEQKRETVTGKDGKNKYILLRKGLVFLHDNIDERDFVPQGLHYKINTKMIDYFLRVSSGQYIDVFKDKISKNPDVMYEEIDEKIASVLFEEFYNTKYPSKFGKFMKVYSSFVKEIRGKTYHTILSKNSTQNSLGALLLDDDCLLRRYLPEEKIWINAENTKEVVDLINQKNMNEYKMFHSKFKYLGFVSVRNEFKLITFDGPLKITQKGEISASKNPRGKKSTEFHYNRYTVGSKPNISDVFEYHKETQIGSDPKKVFYHDLRDILEKLGRVIYR